MTAAPMRLYKAIAEIISIEGCHIMPEMVIPRRNIITKYPTITSKLTKGVGAWMLYLRLKYQNIYAEQTAKEYIHETLLTNSWLLG